MQSTHKLLSNSSEQIYDPDALVKRFIDGELSIESAANIAVRGQDQHLGRLVVCRVTAQLNEYVWRHVKLGQKRFKARGHCVGPVANPGLSRCDLS
jgi:hypothetical protein